MEGKYGHWFLSYVFASTSATIVSGSLAERGKINSYLVFSCIMTGLIFPIVSAWVWGGGFLKKLGFYDFAGSGVVHLTGGIAGLAAAVICGPRLGKFKSIREEGDIGKNDNFDIVPQDEDESSIDGYKNVYHKFTSKHWDISRVHEFVRSYNTKLDNENFCSNAPHNVVLGTLILWLGWLSFNAGSSNLIGDDGEPNHLRAERAIMNTILAPSAGGLFTLFSKQHITGEKQHVRLDPQGLTNGILAGLVCITASSDSVDSWSAILIGIIGSLTYSYSVKISTHYKVDDPLEAFQVHGCCGFIGLLSVAFFKKDKGILYSYKSFEDEDGNKVVAGFEFLLVQFLGGLMIIIWSGTIASIYFFISKKMGTLRLSVQEEILGGDIFYFGPIKFKGKLAEYDQTENIRNLI